MIATLELRPVPLIETERLLLRQPKLADAADLHRAFADPEVVRYVGDGSTATLADVEEGIAQWLERWRRWEIGFYSIERKEDGRVLGRAGFVRWDLERSQVGGTETELGWLLARQHWGCGYATEAAVALRDWAIGERGLRRVISLIHPDNESSIRVAARIGESFERQILFRGHRTLLYSLEAE